MSTRRGALAMGLLVLGAVTSARGAVPEVTGLRSDIYSATAIELFWDRVPNRALTYEIERDDGATATTDGTSYFDPGRAPGASTDYSVTAIDEDGARSAAATITVGPYDRASLQPLRLRADVYSHTAAELFWLRVPDRALSYEVMRDDGLVAVTDGNSYFDDTRTRGVTNTYTVTTIDEEGVRHLPATLTVPPFGAESVRAPAVTGLRASVYSATAAELFWDRVPNRALRYEVLRDDGLSNVTNGTSFFDNRRRAGVSNRYIVTTIDENGNRSSPRSVDVPGG